MTTLKLHLTDLKARRKAAWGIAQCSFVILMVGGGAVYHLVAGSSWYWPAFGVVLTALFIAGLVSSIRDFRKARTRYASIEELLEGDV